MVIPSVSVPPINLQTLSGRKVVAVIMARHLVYSPFRYRKNVLIVLSRVQFSDTLVRIYIRLLLRPTSWPS